MHTLKLDVLVIGGGIAGLWLLAELRAQGYQALLASDELGKGQTIASQGIIHGGTKYALTGQVSQAALAISDMPTIWRRALQGQGAVDLSSAKLHTEHQLLWTSGGIGSRMTGFFASKAMRSRMDAIPRADYPTLFQQPDFKGQLYQLDEPVLDIPSVLSALQKQLAPNLLHINPEHSQLEQTQDEVIYQAQLANGATKRISAKTIVLTAGAGNEALLQYLPDKVNSTIKRALPTMQRRPLQMLMAKGQLPFLYAHALGMSDKPRITITSHPHQDGDTVWYIGGLPAEQGANQSPELAINSAQQELQNLLPWLDMKGLSWSSWSVDRAEGTQANGKRPDVPALYHYQNLLIGWPTKLAFAPMFAQQVLQQLSPPSPPENLPRFIQSPPPIATPVWDQSTFATIPF